MITIIIYLRSILLLVGEEASMHPQTPHICERPQPVLTGAHRSLPATLKVVTKEYGLLPAGFFQCRHSVH